MLAEQERPAVPEHGEPAELVAGVGLGDRPGPGGQHLPGEQGGGRVVVDDFGVEVGAVGDVRRVGHQQVHCAGPV